MVCGIESNYDISFDVVRKRLKPDEFVHRIFSEFLTAVEWWLWFFVKRWWWRRIFRRRERRWRRAWFLKRNHPPLICHVDMFSDIPLDGFLFGGAKHQQANLFGRRDIINQHHAREFKDSWKQKVLIFFWWSVFTGQGISRNNPYISKLGWTAMVL